MTAPHDHRGAAYRTRTPRDPYAGPTRVRVTVQGPRKGWLGRWLRDLLDRLVGVLTLRQTRQRWQRAGAAFRSELTRQPPAPQQRSTGGSGGGGGGGLVATVTRDPSTPPAGDDDLACLAYLGQPAPTGDGTCPACGATGDATPGAPLLAHVPGPLLPDVPDATRKALFLAYAHDQLAAGTWQPDRAWDMFVPTGTQAPDWLREVWFDWERHTDQLPGAREAAMDGRAAFDAAALAVEADQAAAAGGVDQ